MTDPTADAAKLLNEPQMAEALAQKSILGWWFAASNKLPHNDNRLIRVGRAHVHKGEVVPCQGGLHSSERLIDALGFAPGPILYRVRASGVIVPHDDKMAASKREYLARIDASDILRQFSRSVALEQIDRLKLQVPDVVRQWLLTGDENLRSVARSAAWSAAESAARRAAESAAWSAARRAAMIAARSAAESAAWSAAESAAESAARSAAESAAESAARSAAWSAARRAAESAQNDQLTKAVLKALRAKGYRGQ